MKAAGWLFTGLIVGALLGGAGGYFYRQHEFQQALDRILAPSPLEAAEAYVAAVPPPPPPSPAWEVTRETSAMTDKANVFAEISNADADFPARLVVRCLDDEQGVFMIAPVPLSATYGDYGVRRQFGMVRFDDKPAVEREFGVFGEGRHIGYTLTAKAKPLIADMRKGFTMLWRVTSADGRPADVRFDLNGFAPIGEEIQKACK